LIAPVLNLNSQVIILQNTVIVFAQIPQNLSSAFHFKPWAAPERGRAAAPYALALPFPQLSPYQIWIVAYSQRRI